MSRNFVAKHAGKSNRAVVMKDRAKAHKRGDRKHRPAKAAQSERLFCGGLS